MNISHTNEEDKTQAYATDRLQALPVRSNPAEKGCVLYHKWKILTITLNVNRVYNVNIPVIDNFSKKDHRQLGFVSSKLHLKVITSTQSPFNQ